MKECNKVSAGAWGRSRRGMKLRSSGTRRWLQGKKVGGRAGVIKTVADTETHPCPLLTGDGDFCLLGGGSVAQWSVNVTSP